ncbi:MAG: biotin--[acetyl-CoA-carboxylase] ligase [Rhodospirillales bacterium]
MTRPALPDGWRLVEVAETDSTNDEAHRLIAAGAGHGTVVRADRQSAGRGRRGRTWVSPPGNLYMSIVAEVTAAQAGQLAFVAALAAGDALAAGGCVRFKWPNDLMVRGRKAGGILIEADGGFAVVGIGVNVVSAPAETAYPATSLADAGWPPAAPAVLCADVAAGFAAWYARWRSEGFAPVREAWLGRAAGLGGPVTARLPAATCRGTFRALDQDGALILEEADGALRRIAAGDVSLGA